MRRFFSLAATAAVFVMAVPMSANAQDAERDVRVALAERAIEASQTDQMADQMTAIMQALPRPRHSGLSLAERAALEEVEAEVMRSMMDRMMDGMVALFADLYTREELEAMVAFYESAVGQSILTKTNQATPQIIELVRGLLPDVARQMVNGMCDRLDCTDQERAEAMRQALAGLGLAES